MSLRNGFLLRLGMIMCAVAAFAGTSSAQITVTVTGTTPGGFPIPSGTSGPAPGTPINVKATVSPLSGITKVVFYRNDVPYFTDTSWPYQITQDQLGQDNYTYHARAYDSTGASGDSNDYKLTYYSPRVFRMGDAIPAPSPAPSPSPTPFQTYGPDRYHDHTAEVQAAVNYLGEQGGGTLFFPCTIPPLPEQIAIYNIKSTIYVPANVTLQGESAEDLGRCRIYWNDVLFIPPPINGEPQACGPTPTYLRNAAMFKIVGGTSRVRFKDLLLMSRTTGPNCPNRSDWKDIALENTAGVEMNTDDEKGSGDITDTIFENVSITHFTRGIKAVSNNESGDEYEISSVKIRAYHPSGNTAALYIDARYAYNWDIQNFNPASTARGQGSVEIINAGRPSVTEGESTNIRFLQLNCNGLRTEPRPFCVKVQKHGGLYFRQLHHEGVDKALIVEDISSRPWPNNTNSDPIVFESGVASGEFNDASMTLYLIGNGIIAAPETAQAGADDARLRFKGLGRNSTVVDCGDVHWDVTDINGGAPDWSDFKMLFTHSERYRGSFFAETGSASYIKPHTYCPANIAEIGAEFFDSGTMPNEPGLYSRELNYSNCPPSTCNVAATLTNLFAPGGSVYINGTFTVNDTVTIPRGSQIIGAPNAELILGTANKPLFRLHVKILIQDVNDYRLSGVVIRDLKLSTTQSGTTGIAFIGEFDNELPPAPATGRPGVSSDIHFSGLTFQGFTTGLYFAPDPGERQGNPMIDGLSFKDLTFINNTTAALNTSQNSSNWNVMNLTIQSSSPGALGWIQHYGGHQGLQDVTCTGTSGQMTDCIRVEMVGGFYLNRLRRTTNVLNSLTVGTNGTVHSGIYLAHHPASMVLRNSDFTSSVTETGRMNVLGKAFITSMNNKYQYFNVESPFQGNLSRLTYCGDLYTGAGGAAYPGLADTHPNLWVGLPTPTRVQCSPNPMAYEEAVRWTNNWEDDYVGTPLVGNFFHDTEEDFVVYRPESQSRFLIQQPGGPGRSDIPWGLAGDIPMIGRFYPNTRAYIVVWRPSTGDFWAYNPLTTTHFGWHWGQTGDVPFIGNFIDESGPVSGNHDETAVYRPADKTFYISNPRTGAWFGFATAPDNDSKIQVADFLGLGYDQIAQFKAGQWKITDPRPPRHTYTVNFTLGDQTGDIPVAGKYLPQLPGRNFCAQIGIWRPSTQEFLVADPIFIGTDPPTNCGTRSTTSMVWGLNHGHYPDDIPLTIGTANGLLRRPTAYRRTKGVYDHSLADGQWWVHDPF